MKLHKVNKNGSLSIILPKAITKENNWIEGDEIDIIANNKNSIIISKKQIEGKSLDEVLTMLEVSLNSFKTLLKTVTDEQVIKDLLKTHLLSIIEEI